MGHKGVRSGASLEEIREVYESSLEAFVRTASAICGSHEAGQDAVHDAVVSALKGRAAYRGDGSVEAWLWSAVVRTALKRQSRLREFPFADPLAGREPLAEGDVRGLFDDERAAIARLPERQRLVLFLRYFGDLDYEQIAEALGVKRGTVGAALHDAQETLRTRLQGVTRDVG